MTGRQVILINKPLSLDQLLQFMNENWDKETYNGFTKGKPTPASIEEYILLPATENYMVIAFPRKADGLFSKKNKVVLSVCDTPAGAVKNIIISLPTRRVFTGGAKIAATISREEERKGPAEEALLFYTKHMTDLLKGAGLTE